jgi:hypothetical protein
MYIATFLLLVLPGISNTLGLPIHLMSHHDMEGLSDIILFQHLAPLVNCLVQCHILPILGEPVKKCIHHIDCSPFQWTPRVRGERAIQCSGLPVNVVCAVVTADFTSRMAEAGTRSQYGFQLEILRLDIRELTMA